MSSLSITWLGHATFIITTPGGKRIVIDPWLEGNPMCPADHKRIDKADVILLTHGHSDHSSDVVNVARSTGAPVVGVFEISVWLTGKGLQNVIGMGIGGTISVAGLEITMVPAVHTSSVVENGSIVYLGEPAGFVVRMENGQAFYFAGDTALFGDMRLIGEMHSPDVAFLPIGDHFTMGPDAAARACLMLGVRQVVPMHYGTFPILTGTPDRLKQLVEPHGIDVLVLKPGQTAS
ncbi:MAG TPA: metal-dependent hydrolase [Vicinamibacterales bacterium]|jgi:L-ascorbate metabolism protein UlaG (beta-lactamase superfamily)|nr:metal-dependent hydrolase [Vicinamibacterales bacterium]